MQSRFHCNVSFLNASNLVPVMEPRQAERRAAETKEPEVQHSSDDKDAAILLNYEVRRRTSLTGCAPLALCLTKRGER